MGPSMLPNFNMTGDIVAVDHITPRFKGYDLGDVVVCISPCVPGRAVLKRILGLVQRRATFATNIILYSLVLLFLSLVIMYASIQQYQIENI